MLFKNLKPFFVAVSLASSLTTVSGAPIITCGQQQPCITFTVTEATTSLCGECEFTVCLNLDTSKQGCIKDGGAISHGCTKPANSCASSSLLTFPDTIAGAPTYYGCQTVAAGGFAEFIIKDGNDPKLGCESSSSYSLSGAIVSCAPSEARTCTGNGNIGKECLWKVQAPASCVATPSPPSPTPPPPTPIVTPTPPPPTPTPPPPTTAPPPGCQSLTVREPNYCPCNNPGANGFCNDLCLVGEPGDYPKYGQPRGYCGCTDFRDGDDCDRDGIPDCIDEKTCPTPPPPTTPSPPTTTPPPPTTPSPPTTTPPPPTTPSPPTTTPPPPTTPSPPVPTPSGAQGDPHFKTWAGEKYDFHGACDLVLVQTPGFVGGLGMNVHIRTTRMEGVFSYISAAAVAIGEDTLEVGGDSENMMYWVNGVKGEEPTEDALLPHTLSGYPIKFRIIDDENKDFIISLGQNGTVAITTWNGYVGVDIYDATEENFASSVGLLGDYKGSKVGRDGQIITDINEFGQEWQVLNSERKLFHSVVGPQHPEKCLIPSPAAHAHRRLSQSSIDQDAAERACAVVIDANRESCIFDVMATGNLKMARAYK